MLLCHFDGLLHAVGRANRRAPNAKDDTGREKTRRTVSIDRPAERLRIERPGTIGRDFDEMLLADTGDADRLVNRRVGLR